MNVRNSLIHLTNRLGVYNHLRDFLYKSRKDNPHRCKFLSQFFTQGSLCFDVGANIGETVDLFRSIGVKVIAIEPQAGCAAYLRKKYRNDNQVTIVEKAISTQEGKAQMLACEANQLSTLSEDFKQALDKSQRFGELPDYKRIDVLTTTLEAMIQEYGRPDFLKIDVEGWEHEVLKSLKSQVPFISFEYTYPENIHSLELCIKHLDELGNAQYNLSDHDYSRLEFPQWCSSQELLAWLHRESAKNPCGNIYVKYPCA